MFNNLILEEDVYENSIFCNMFSCHKIYDSERRFLDLKTNKFFEINFIVSGEGVLSIFNQEIPCKKGDICIIPPNVLHEYFIYSKEENLVVKQIQFDISTWFDGEIIDCESKNYCFGVLNESRMFAYATLNSIMQDKVHFLCDCIENEIAEKKYGFYELTKGYLANLLISTERYVDSAIKNITFFSSKSWVTVSSAIDIVKEEYSDDRLSLEMISKRLYVSQSQLSRTFKKMLGIPFSKYLRDVRIKEACKLLNKSCENVDAIARKCGFLDIPTFYKVFNSSVGTTPNKYRKSVATFEKSKNKTKKFLNGEKIMCILSEISENLQNGKAKVVKELVQQALDEGVKPEDILNEALLAGMSVIGEKFKNNEIFVPEVLIAARAMNMGAQILKPRLAEIAVQAQGKVCIGTVQGDLHDIGKNLVKMMMEGRGLEVVDIGVDAPPENFIKTAIEENCQVICCSALLTTTMGVMEEVVKAAEDAGIRDRIKIMIGGAPVSQEFCDKIGADCYTPDATTAADAAVKFCKA